jgi:hypothetical protein
VKVTPAKDPRQQNSAGARQKILSLVLIVAGLCGVQKKMKKTQAVPVAWNM